MKSIENFNQEITKIWEDYSEAFPQYTEYIPEYIFRNLKKNTILFIGLNPSMNIDFWNNELKEINIKIKAQKLFLWENRVNYNQKFLKEIYNKIKPISKYKTYYEPFKTFAKDCKFKKFEHLDILFFREGNQNIIKDNIDYKNGKIIFLDPKREKNSRHKNFKKLEEFLEKQVKITKEIAIKLNPKIICVFNALASRIVENSWNLNNISGSPAHWSINNSKGKKIPVILGPMLSNGQMDIYTRKRLEKDIINILKRYK